jgi:hypothetical protein
MLPCAASLDGRRRATLAAMGHPSEPTWTAVVAELAQQDHPAARANAWLLEQAGARWAGHVDPHPAMHDLLFALPGDEAPFQTSVKVQWADGWFELWLVDDGFLVTADRGEDATAPALLDAFLLQLTGEP